MKCLVFSDTHGNDMLLRKALSLHRDAEVMFFLGDGLSDIAELDLFGRNIALIAVRGNCDFRSELNGIPVKKTEMLKLMGKRIVLTHGDLYYAKQGTAMLEKLAEDTNADIVLFGHTHEKLEKYVNVENKYDGNSAYADRIGTMKNYYLFNPGTAGSYNGSYGILTLGDEICLFSHGS